MDNTIKEIHYEIPTIGSTWESKVKYPGGGRSNGTVVFVTHPFNSATFGEQEPTVILSGIDAFGLESVLAYKASDFLKAHDPTYQASTMIRIYNNLQYKEPTQ